MIDLLALCRCMCESSIGLLHISTDKWQMKERKKKDCGSVMLRTTFVCAGMVWVILFPANQYKTLQTDPITKQFYRVKRVVSSRLTLHPSRSSLKWFEEDEDDINRMLWPSQSPDLNPNEYLGDILQLSTNNIKTLKEKKKSHWSYLSFRRMIVQYNSRGRENLGQTQ